MSIDKRAAAAAGICPACARRAWLLGELGPTLDFCARDPARLLAALSLEDAQLIRGLGGRRAAQLAARWERRALQPSGEGDAWAPGICRHDARYPQALCHDLAPRAVLLAGDPERFCALTEAPVVALVGSERASDYGLAVAASLARGLAASGVTVAGTLGDGIAGAAHAGVLQTRGAGIAVLDGGVCATRPARLRALLQRVTHAGCGVAELPAASLSRRWCAIAGGRTAAALAQVTVIVEATERPRELAAAQAAQLMGRTLGATPGRVTSPLSAGTNALLAEGHARVIRAPEDVLELLDLPAHNRDGGLVRTLDPRLRATLADVGAGRDTPQKLMREGADRGEVLMRLSELELMGLLARGDGGRYVPRENPSAW